MSRKHSTTAARKRLKPATCWGRYILAGALLLAVLGAAGATGQMLLATSASPEPSAAAASGAAGATGSAHTLYAHGHQLRPLVEETDGAQTLNIYGPGDQVIAQATRDDQGNEGVRYLLTDHLGSTRVVVGADGKAVARYEYAPHGETTIAGTAAAEVQYRYTGHPYDESQRLYQTPNRGYDPTTGRFLSVDPQRQDASPYVYAGNNPVLYKDPNGKGRTRSVVTPRVFQKAKELAEETSTYESNSRLMDKINDPKVEKWFDTFETLYSKAPELYHQFVDRIVHLNEFQKENIEALGYRFSDLEGTVPQLPRTDDQLRVKIMENMKKHDRGVLRDIAGERHRRRAIWLDFEGNQEEFYKSKGAMDSLLVTPKNERPDPDARVGYGNCSLISSCIGGQIARIDPEVTVELIQADPSVDHSFIVVGRDPKTDVSNPMTWNKSALIVDSWQNIVTEARQYYSQGINTEYYSLRHSPEVLYTFK